MHSAVHIQRFLHGVLEGSGHPLTSGGVGAATDLRPQPPIQHTGVC
jgi:hypothetical protein